MASVVDATAKKASKKTAKTSTETMAEPSFAYPKTVSKDAEKQLQKALSEKDAHSALNALIKIFIAEGLIDADNIPKSINKIEEVSEKFANDSIHGLYLAFLAKAYSCMYSTDRWKFDRREIPLQPYPKDMTEWSGDQYQQKIKELCIASVSGKDGEKLRGCATDRYTDLIEIGQLEMTYYPNLLDFVYQNALELSSDLDDSAEFKEEIIDKAYTQAAAASPSQILWLSKKEANKTFDQLQKIFDEYSDNPYAGLLFMQLYKKIASSEEVILVDEDGQTQQTVKKSTLNKKWLCDNGEKYIQQFPKTPFKGMINNYISQIKEPQVKYSWQSSCKPGQEVDIKISAENANKYKILIYKLTDNISPVWKTVNISSKEIKNRYTPIKTFDITTNRQLPFATDTILKTTFEQTGYYVMIAEIDGQVSSAINATSIKCIPAYPLTVSNTTIPMVVVVDPLTGKPMSGINVMLKDDKIVKFTKKTDAQGISKFAEVSQERTYDVTLDIKGKIYVYDDISLTKKRDKEKKEDRYYTQINTDLALYHPGDTVRALIVAYINTYDEDNYMHTRLAEKKEMEVTLKDANNQPVTTTTCTADAFGRATVEFPLPVDGLTGRYTINVSFAENRYGGIETFEVSDYKMPDFYLEVTAVAHDVPTKGDVSIIGKSMTYSGMPLAETKIETVVTGESWRYGADSGKKIYSTNVLTGDDGIFTIVVPDSTLQANKKYQCFYATIDAVSSSGSTATTSKIFSIGKHYYIVMTINGENVDGTKPFAPNVKVYAPGDSIVTPPVVWALKKNNVTVASGDFDGNIDLSAITPGRYTFSVVTKDSTLAEPNKVAITLYNTNTDISPTETPLWFEKKKITYTDGDIPSLLYATKYDTTYIYCLYHNSKGQVKSQMMEVGKGYHKLDFDPSIINESEYLEMITVKDMQTQVQCVTFEKTKNEKLDIKAEAFRDNLMPGNLETWKFTITNPDGEGVKSALALDMYNKALDALRLQTFRMNFPKQYTYNDLQIDKIYYTTKSGSYLIAADRMRFNFEDPEFNTYHKLDYGWGSSSRHVYFMAEPTMSNALSVDKERYCKSAVDKEEVCADLMDDSITGAGSVEADNGAETPAPEQGDGTAEKEEDIDYRDSNVPLAIWAPMLTSDNNGNIEYTFTVPNANTTWSLNAIAWSKDMKVGHLMHEFVASKPIMVQPNLPRFLRVGDEAVVTAMILNKTDEMQEVTSTIEIFDPFTGQVLSTKTEKSELSANGKTVINIPVTVDESQAAIGIRVKSTNGKYSDGEQNVIKVLPNISPLIETTPFYLNPGDTIYTMKLPSHKKQKLSLSFCENPVWTIVSALPGLRENIKDYANAAAAALFSASISKGIVKENPTIAKVLKEWTDGDPKNTALISQLEKNEDLKISLLNSTPWVLAAQSDTERMANLALILDQKEVDKAIKQSLDILAKLQNSDGGWKWGNWCTESSVWVTGNVLTMIAKLKTLGWLPADSKLNNMVNNALRYYDRNVEHTDLEYSIVRPQFDNITISSNGMNVINATLKDIRKNWKNYDDVAHKSMAALALYYNKDTAMANKLMGSVSEFGVWSESQGLKFPSVNALYSYAVILEAFATILPQSKEVDGLRQQLIVRKQGTDWGNAVVTNEVVQSILTSGSKWTVVDTKAEVRVGNHNVTPDTPVEKATGYFRANLSEYGGKELTVSTSGTGPSYGAVYAQFQQKMQDVKAYSIDDLDIEKTLLVRRGTEWEHADQLRVGDRVKVQLTIHCKRNLQYVSIVDERPATFEPVQQLPGWVWSEGTRFYRENRDSSTQLHIQWLIPGTYLLTYEMNVGIAGTFTSGVATIQSQYAPEITAHSSGCVLNILPQE